MNLFIRAGGMLPLLQSTTSPIIPNHIIGSIQVKSDASKITSDYPNNTDWSPTNSDSSDMPLNLIFALSQTEEEIELYERGYKYTSKICNTLQGELLKAEVIADNKNAKLGSYVAIKKVDKNLCDDGIAIEDGMSFCVTENIVKEAMILKHLTVDSKSAMCRDYIIGFVDFFVTECYYYLVTDYIPNCINLKQYISESTELIRNGTLDLKEYSKSVKFIMWQLAIVIQWLHEVYHCCHMNLSVSNILIENGTHIKISDGQYKSNRKISVKLANFGVAELFKVTKNDVNKPFKCNKQDLSINNMCHVCPQIMNQETYDAKSADCFAVGLIMYHAIVGEPLFDADDVIFATTNNGYDAVVSNNVRKYLNGKGLLQYFNSKSFSLLQNLLNVHENKRITASSMLKHSWFKSYYKRYKNVLNKELNFDSKMCIQKEIQNIKNLSFYCLYDS